MVVSPRVRFKVQKSRSSNLPDLLVHGLIFCNGNGSPLDQNFTMHRESWNFLLNAGQLSPAFC